MSGYKHLYLKLFNAITDIIETLKKVQIETEEEYLKLCEKEDDENKLVNFNVFKD